MRIAHEWFWSQQTALCEVTEPTPQREVQTFLSGRDAAWARLSSPKWAGVLEGFEQTVCPLLHDHSYAVPQQILKSEVRLPNDKNMAEAACWLSAHNHNQKVRDMLPRRNTWVELNKHEPIRVGLHNGEEPLVGLFQ